MDLLEKLLIVRTHQPQKDRKEFFYVSVCTLPTLAHYIKK